MKKCFFCEFAKEPNKNTDIFFENENVFAMLDIDWAVKGHALVVWKKHALNISDLSEDEFIHFSTVCRKIESKLLEVLGVDKSVILKSGGLESHFHFHIYPVSSDTDWETIKNISDKKTKYIPGDGEKELLLKSLSNL